MIAISFTIKEYKPQKLFLQQIEINVLQDLKNDVEIIHLSDLVNIAKTKDEQTEIEPKKNQTNAEPNFQINMNLADALVDIKQDMDGLKTTKQINRVHE